MEGGPEHLMAICERLQEICAGESYRVVGERTGTHPESARRYVRGESWPTLRFIIEVSDKYGKPIDYIVNGESAAGSSRTDEEVIAAADSELLVNEITHRLNTREPLADDHFDEIIERTPAQQPPERQHSTPGRKANSRGTGIGKDAESHAHRSHA